MVKKWGQNGTARFLLVLVIASAVSSTRVSRRKSYHEQQLAGESSSLYWPCSWQESA